MGQGLQFALVCAFFLPIVVPLFTCIAVVTKIFPTIRQLYLSMVWIRIGKYPILMKTKEAMFSELRSIKSKDPELLKANSLRLLELGIGEGTNLRFYPNGCRLVAVDVIPKFEILLQRRLYKFPQIELERFVVGSATELTAIPNESVDVVVCTHVLCHVTDHTAVFKEVQRILVEGGKFFFLEHVAHPKQTHYYLWQKLMRHIWSLFFECNLLNPFLEKLRRARFQELKLSYKNFLELPFLFSPHVWGFAVK